MVAARAKPSGSAVRTRPHDQRWGAVAVEVDGDEHEGAEQYEVAAQAAWASPGPIPPVRSKARSTRGRGWVCWRRVKAHPARIAAPHEGEGGPEGQAQSRGDGQGEQGTGGGGGQEQDGGRVDAGAGGALACSR